MFIRLVLSLLVVSAANVASAEMKDSCQDQLFQAKAMSGNYQNDYSRKVTELSIAQAQLYLAQQKIKALEEELKKKNDVGSDSSRTK